MSKERDQFLWHLSILKKGGAEKVLHRIVTGQRNGIYICLHMQIKICLINNSTGFYGSHPTNQPDSFEVRLRYGPLSYHKKAISPTNNFFCSYEDEIFYFPIKAQNEIIQNYTINSRYLNLSKSVWQSTNAVREKTLKTTKKGTSMSIWTNHM